MASFTEQRQTHAVLLSRSRELLGAGSIAGTITTIAGNQKIFSAAKPPSWWLVLIVASILIEIAAALGAMHPMAMAVSINPPDLKAKMESPGFVDLTIDQWYQAIAYSLIGDGAQSHFHQNARRNAVLARVVQVQVWALASIVILAAVLLFVL